MSLEAERSFMFGHMVCCPEAWLHICSSEKSWLGSLRDYTQPSWERSTIWGVRQGDQP
jgi:hypothetical protein